MVVAAVKATRVSPRVRITIFGKLIDTAVLGGAIGEKRLRAALRPWGQRHRDGDRPALRLERLRDATPEPTSCW
jgi:hypothetical protein